MALGNDFKGKSDRHGEKVSKYLKKKDLITKSIISNGESIELI